MFLSRSVKYVRCWSQTVVSPLPGGFGRYAETTIRSWDIRRDVSSGTFGIGGKDLPLRRIKDHRPRPVGSCPFDFTAWLTSSKTVARHPPYWKLLVRFASCLLKATEE